MQLLLNINKRLYFTLSKAEWTYVLLGGRGRQGGVGERGLSCSGHISSQGLGTAPGPVWWLLEEEAGWQLCWEQPEVRSIEGWEVRPAQFCSSHSRTNLLNSPNARQCHSICPKTNCDLEAGRLCWASRLMQASSWIPKGPWAGESPSGSPGVAKSTHRQHVLRGWGHRPLAQGGKLAWQSLFCWAPLAGAALPSALEIWSGLSAGEAVCSEGPACLQNPRILPVS